MTERSILTKMLQLYRDLPCLWDISNESYKNKNARKEALTILLEKYKEIDSKANHDTVKRKIENFRTTFLREWKKVESSKSTEASADSIYKPSLWYYDLMLFLVENQTPKRSGTDSIQNTDSQGSVKIDNKTKENKRRMTEFQKKRAKFFDFAQNMVSSEDNPTEILAHAFARQLKEMTKLQRCIAEKMIAEILCYGKLDLLTIQSTISLNSNTGNSIATHSSPSPQTSLLLIPSQSLSPPIPCPRTSPHTFSPSPSPESLPGPNTYSINSPLLRSKSQNRSLKPSHTFSTFPSPESIPGPGPSKKIKVFKPQLIKNTQYIKPVPECYNNDNSLNLPVHNTLSKTLHTNESQTIPVSMPENSCNNTYIVPDAISPQPENTEIEMGECVTYKQERKFFN